MKNLKKVLALVLALSMILSTFTALTLTASAAAEPTFSDIAGTSYEDAVEVLAALNIVAGYEDGTYGGDKVVTRAEMAAFIVREIGLAATASSATSGNQYSDVAADHWALGSINVATQKKIIVGNGDGTFAPNDTVSYQAAVKMLVCALGYEVVANRNGGWPAGYLIQGAALGLTDGITGIDGADGCNRGVVASLLYNALEIELMEEVQYSGSAVVQEPDTNKTFLRDNLGYDKYVDAEIVATATQGDNRTTAGLATIRGKLSHLNVIYAQDYNYIYDKPSSITNKVQVGETDPDAFFGDAVIIYVKRSANSNVADTIACIVNDNVTQETLEIDVADLYSSNPLLTYLDENTETKNNSDKYDRLYYKGEEDTKAQYAKLLSTGYFEGCEFVINGRSDHGLDWTILEDKALKNGTIRLIDAKTFDFATSASTAGADGYYEKIVLDTYLDFVVSEVDADEEKVLTVNDIDLVFDDTKIFTITDAEGNELKLEDLQENDVLSVFPDTWATTGDKKDVIDQSEVLKVVVYNNPLEGSVSETTKKAVYVDGTKYDVAGDLVKITDFEVGDEGTFYLNAAGDIVFADTTPAAKDYAVFYDVYQDGARTIKFSALTSAGENLTLTASSAIDIVKYSKASGVYQATKAVEYDFTVEGDASKGIKSDIEKALDEVATTKAGAYKPYIAKYKVKAGSDNVIDTIYIADVAVDASTEFKNDRFGLWEKSINAYYNANESTFGSYMVDASSVIFDIPLSVTGVRDSDKIKVLSKSGLKNSETYEGTSIYEVDKNNVVKAAIIYSQASKIDVKDPIAVIQAVTRAKNADGNDIFKIYMIQDGKSVVKETDDDKVFSDYDYDDLYKVQGYTDYSIKVAYGVYPGAAIFYNEATDGAIDAIERIYPTTSYAGDETDVVPYYMTEFYTTWDNDAAQKHRKENCDALIIVGEVIDKSTNNKTITIASTVKAGEKDAPVATNFIANYSSAKITVVDYRFEESEDIVAAGSPSDIKERKYADDGVTVEETGSIVLVRKQSGTTKDIVVYNSFDPLAKPLV